MTTFVCVTCRGREDAEARPGRVFFEAIRDRAADVVAVECLSVCKRPCTVAFAAPGKWTYVYADLDLTLHLEDVVAAAAQYDDTSDGIIPWRERPSCIRKGVVSRVPPLTGFTPRA